MTEVIIKIDEDKYMLKLGDNDDEPNLAIQDVSGKIEQFDIFLNINSQSDVERLKKIFHAEGSNVKKLGWYFIFSKHEMLAADVTEMLNCFTNVETLILSNFDVKFIGDCCEKIHLPNIKSLKIEDCENFIIDFLTNTLSENSIPELILGKVKDIEDNLYEFIRKQTSIKKLTLCEDLKTIEPFKLLNLESLHCPIRCDGEKIKHQREFVNSLIKSQVNLKSFGFFDESAYSFMNDEVFANICGLSKLESLSIHIEEITSEGIKAVSNLTSLKTLTIYNANRDESTENLKVLKEFGAIQNSPIENLTLGLWFEIPDQIYREIGQNYQNLKSLTVSHRTNQRFSLFAKSFRNIESLDITLGDCNPPVAFDEVYDENDDVMFPKLKNLKIFIYSDIDSKLFFKFLSNFPSLVKLDIHAELPFTADFINQFANNLNSIKHVKFFFEIKNKDTFPTELSDALKLLRSKLNYIYIYLRNRQKFRGDDPNFTYKPLIDKLKDIFKIKESFSRLVYIDKSLNLEAGQQE